MKRLPSVSRSNATTRARLLVAAVSLATITGGIYGLRVILDQREEIRMLQQRADQRARDAATLRRQHDGTARELSMAELQLARLAPRSIDSGSARQMEIRAWLACLKRLKQLVTEKPEHSIPELRLLTDDDWLRVARRVELETDEHVRKALATLRDTAKGKFRSLLTRALMKFTKHFDGQLPPTTLALASYFEHPVEPAMLQRYEMIASGKVSDVGALGAWVIREAAPVDADYDGRFHVGAKGSGGILPGPGAWLPGFQENSRRAREDYAKAHNGMRPANLAQTLSYFDPPLEPATIERLLKAERERSSSPP